MRFERVAGKTRRFKLSVWATRQRPVAIVSATCHVYYGDGLSASVGLALAGVGFNLSTYRHMDKAEK